jgi:spore maturation protein CgeB
MDGRAHARPHSRTYTCRLWEALASKALVLVDYLYAPMGPCPLLDGQDVVYFDPYDRGAFQRKLRFYLANPEEARRIAFNGFTKVGGVVGIAVVRRGGRQ